MADLNLLGAMIEGAKVALTFHALFYCLIGVALGMFVGVIPGTGIMATIAMLMPLTFHLDPTDGLIMLAGLYYGAAYGGSTSSILLNIPGTPQTAVTALDGYPMAQNGKAGLALFITTIASFVGSMFGLLLLVLLSPVLAKIAQSFGAQDYFSLMIFGLAAAALLTGSHPLRSLAMVAFGLFLGMVGVDPNSGMERFTFGQFGLYDGLSLTAVTLGLFGIPEIVSNATRPSRGTLEKVTLKSMLPTRSEWRRSSGPIGRGSLIGAGLGALPGTGALLATFISYAVERRISKHPKEFGKGAIEGVAAPEAANNAAIQTAFIPTLTLGVPGDAVMALMMSALFIHGIAPGPMLLVNEPSLFWGLAVSFLIGNLILLLLNLPLIKVWVSVLNIPYTIIFPCVIVFICIGVYSLKMSQFDLIILMLFGLVGYGMRLLNFDVAPLILGLVLGPLIETYFRRSMVLSRGDLMGFLERPISAGLLTLLAAIAIFSIARRVGRIRSKNG